MPVSACALRSQIAHTNTSRTTTSSMQVFATLSEKPVASASLGQVYQATLVGGFGGGTVAVKVQRPGILNGVALDTLLMRQATEIVSSVPMYAGGWEEVLDDWAVRFFQVYTISSCCMLPDIHSLQP